MSENDAQLETGDGHCEQCSGEMEPFGGYLYPNVMYCPDCVTTRVVS